MLVDEYLPLYDIADASAVDVHADVPKTGYQRKGGRMTIQVGWPESKLWWRNLTGAGATVELRIAGERLRGHGLAVGDEASGVTAKSSASSEWGDEAPHRPTIAGAEAVDPRLAGWRCDRRSERDPPRGHLREATE